VKLYTSPQRGVALIVALLVVALATILIAGLLDRGELALARTRNQLRESQAQSYAMGLEAYAARVLQQAQAQGNSTDTNDSPWAVPLPPTQVPGGSITALMGDLDGRFNINNLDPSASNPNAQIWYGKFQLLLQALKLDPKLADNVVEWMSAPHAGSANNDAFYLGQVVPYRAAQRKLMHVSELRLIKGIDGDVFAKLAPYVAALPAGTPINVNTASVPVLMTLNANVTAQMAQAIWQQGHAQYARLADLKSAEPGLGPIQGPACFGVTSSYFLARGEITLDGLPFEFQSLIERRSGPGGGIRVLQRSRGSD
jgi:general secretion pathway protein K